MSGPSLADVRATGQPPQVLARLNDEHWAGRLYMRRVSPYATVVFARLGWSPNAVTVAFIVSGVAAGVVEAAHARQKRAKVQRRTRTNLRFRRAYCSVALRRSVSLIGMQYPSANLDDAMTKFATKLGESLPGMRCLGWNWSPDIDPARIRAKIDE